MEKRSCLKLTFKEFSRSRIEERGEQRVYEETWSCIIFLLLNLLHTLESYLLLRWKHPSSQKTKPLPSSSSCRNPSLAMTREPQVAIVFMYTQSNRVMYYGMSQISMYMCGKILEWFLERENILKVNLMKGETCIESCGS